MKKVKHGYWKRWGWSVTCSECGCVCEGGNFCPRCGAKMEKEVWEAPKLDSTLKQIEVFVCPVCKELSPWILDDNHDLYCRNCGALIKMGHKYEYCDNLFDMLEEEE